MFSAPTSSAPIQLHHGDCLEVMKGIPNGSVDCVITDPPYEKEAHTLQRRVKRGAGVMEVEPLSFHPITEQERTIAAKEIARVAKRWVLTFCQIEAVPLWRHVYEEVGLLYKRTCLWIQPDGMPQYSGDRPGMGYETILAMHTSTASKWNGGGETWCIYVQQKRQWRQKSSSSYNKTPSAHVLSC